MKFQSFIAASIILVFGVAVAMAGDSATAASYVSKTTARVSLAPRGDLLIATAIVNWDNRASDTLAIAWHAPKGYCKSSQFVIVRGSNVTGDVSWAYRTVIHHLQSGQTIACHGRWIAKVVNVDTGKVLASAGYTVAPVVKNSDYTVSINNPAKKDAEKLDVKTGAPSEPSLLPDSEAVSTS